MLVALWGERGCPRGYPQTHVTHVGGNWNNGVNGGPLTWNLNNGTSESNRNIGDHLFCMFLFFVLAHLASWQNI